MKELIERAREKLAAAANSLGEPIRNYLARLGGDDNPERSIHEFERLSGRGYSRGECFDRNAIHDRF